MYRVYQAVRRILSRIREESVPYARRFLRFLALPYCLVALVDWDECPRPWWRVTEDLLYIFFQLGYFPDNYGACRLWEVDRQKWVLYYGSLYNPWPRATLQRALTPNEYRIVFDDKYVCHQLCKAAGLPTPELLAGCGRGEDVFELLKRFEDRLAGPGIVLKPIRGSAGSGVVVFRRTEGGVVATTGRQTQTVETWSAESDSILQTRILQHPNMDAIYDGSVNTLRMVTVLDGSETKLLSGLARFGVGGAAIDNWSTGGLAIGLDVKSGRLLRTGFAKNGQGHTKHPTSGVAFANREVPDWQEAVGLCDRAQRAFPYYRLLGFDLAITPHGPLVLEINAQPDLVLQEQASGPLLADTETVSTLARCGALYSRAQRELAARLSV